MKKIVFLLLLIPILGQSQTFSLVTKKDSTVVSIQGFTDKEILTSNGTFYFKNVLKAYMHSTDNPDYFRKRFQEADVVLIDQMDASIEAPSQSVLVSNANEIEPRELNQKLLRFQKARTTGFLIEGAGLVTIAVSGVSESTEGLIFGSILSLIGWGVQWGAGQHLK